MSDRVFMREEVREALEDIVKHRNAKALNWAVNYADCGIDMIDSGCNDYDLRTQLIYVKNNITHWRGEDAKRVREILKRAIGNL